MLFFWRIVVRRARRRIPYKYTLFADVKFVSLSKGGLSLRKGHLQRKDEKGREGVYIYFFKVRYDKRIIDGILEILI